MAAVMTMKPNSDVAHASGTCIMGSQGSSVRTPTRREGLGC